MSSDPGTKVGWEKHSDCMLKNCIHYLKVVPDIIATVLCRTVKSLNCFLPKRSIDILWLPSLSRTKIQLLISENLGVWQKVPSLINIMGRGFINFWHKWVVFNIRRVSFWKAQRAFLTRESGGMLPTWVVSLLQEGRITRYTAIIETPDVQLWPYLKVH